MKAYTSVPRDFTRVKEKIIFHLTKRQLICFGLAALVGMPSYFLLKEAADSTTATLCMVIIMVPLFLFAMYEKNGQPLEAVLKNYVQARFLRIKERPYKTCQQSTLQNDKKREPEKPSENLILSFKKWLVRNSPKTAQQSIPYQKMFPDGVCKVRKNFYSLTIQFYDRNYQLLRGEEKEQLLDDWGLFFKLFGSEVQFQLSYLSLPEDMEELTRRLRIPGRFDGLDKLREEHSAMLKNSAVQGKKGLETIRFLTFGVETDSLKQAKAKLSHIEKMVLENFQKMGVEAHALDGAERLKVMHRMFYFSDRGKFFFDWKMLQQSGLHTKDFIAPASFKFDERRIFQVGDGYGAVSYLSITASELDDEVLKDILDSDSCQIVTMHVQTLEQGTAIKMVKRIITEIDRSKIEEQKRAVRSGYDMDISATRS